MERLSRGKNTTYADNLVKRWIRPRILSSTSSSNSDTNTEEEVSDDGTTIKATKKRIAVLERKNALLDEDLRTALQEYEEASKQYEEARRAYEKEKKKLKEEIRKRTQRVKKETHEMREKAVQIREEYYHCIERIKEEATQDEYVVFEEIEIVNSLEEQATAAERSNEEGDAGYASLSQTDCHMKHNGEYSNSPILPEGGMQPVCATIPSSQDIYPVTEEEIKSLEDLLAD